MKRFLSIIAISSLILSCSKESIDGSSWNAIDFTLEKYEQYIDYMDKPYISITFPSTLLKTEESSYSAGIMKKDQRDYVFIGHNWDDKEIVVILYSQNNQISRTTIKPEYSTEKRELEIANFTYTFPQISGVYRIEIELNDGNIKMEENILYDSKNRIELI